jgi:hypothetical protein
MGRLGNVYVPVGEICYNVKYVELCTHLVDIICIPAQNVV